MTKPKIEGRINPCDEIVEIFVDGELIVEWVSDDGNIEPLMNDFTRIFNAAMKVHTNNLSKLNEALIHIADVANRSRSQSRRDVWIQARAESAINGNDDWKDIDKPKNPTNQLLRLRAEVKTLKALIKAANCPCCDGSGAYYDNQGEVCQCQWCDETKEIRKDNAKPT